VTDDQEAPAPTRSAPTESPSASTGSPSPSTGSPSPASTGPLPADPEAYDSPRAVQARARGLAAPYIAGGEDPDPEATRRRERRYLRMLIAMIVVIVLSGFVIGAIAKLLGFPT
jgi:hypothetical protein